MVPHVPKVKDAFKGGVCRPKKQQMPGCALIPAWVTALMLACASFACSSDSSPDAPVAIVPFPSDAVFGPPVPSALRVHLPQHTLDAARRMLPQLIQTLADDFLQDGRFYIPEDLIPTSAIALRDGCIGDNPDPLTDCTQPTARSFLGIDLEDFAQRLQLNWTSSTNGPQLEFVLEDLPIQLDAVLALQIPGFPAAACHIGRRLEAPSAFVLGRVAIAVGVGIHQGLNGPQIELRPSPAEIVLSKDGDPLANLQITPCAPALDELDGEEPQGDTTASNALACRDPLCNGENSETGTCNDLCELGSLLTGLGGLVGAVIDPLLAELAPMLTDFLKDAVAQANLPAALGIVVDPKALLGPPVAAVAKIHLAGQIQSPSLEGDGPGLGLGLHLDLGSAPASVHPCARAHTDAFLQEHSLDSDNTDPNSPLPPHPFLAGQPPPVPTFLEVSAPHTNDDGDAPQGAFVPYHAAASIAEPLLQQALHSAHAAGLFCIDLTDQILADLTGPDVILNAGLLQSFEGGLRDVTSPQAPISLRLHLDSPPKILFEPRPKDPTSMPIAKMRLSIDDLKLGIFIQVDEAQHQLSQLSVDVSVALGLAAQPNGPEPDLQIQIGEISLLDIRESYNEMAPSADLPGLITLAVDLALEALLAGQLSFPLPFEDLVLDALPQELPLRFRIPMVRIETNTDGHRFLAAYGALCPPQQDTSPTDALCFSPTPQSEDDPQLQQAENAIMATASKTHRGVLELDLSAFQNIASAKFIQIQPDRRGFRLPQAWAPKTEHAPRMAIFDPRLQLPGAHQADIRVLDANGRIVAEKSLDIQASKSPQSSGAQAYAVPKPKPKPANAQLAEQSLASQDAPAAMGCQAAPIPGWGWLMLPVLFWRRCKRGR